MEHLALRDVNALLESIRQIYSDMNPDTLAKTVVEMASRIIPCSISIYTKIDIEKMTSATMASSAGFSACDLDFPEYAHEHPFANLLSDGRLKPHPYKEDIEKRFLKRQQTLKGSPGDAVVKITDVLPDSQYRRLAIYNEVAKKNNMDYQMAVPLAVGPGSFDIVNINREKKDFSEKERLLLGMLAPQIVQAFRNAEIISRISEDKTGIGTTLIEGKGKDLPLEHLKFLGITLREAEILKWISEGKTNAEISTILNISLNTVKTHLANIYQKLGVENRVAAAKIILNNELPRAKV